MDSTPIARIAAWLHEPRPRACSVCGGPFVATTVAYVTTCSPECAYEEYSLEAI